MVKLVKVPIENGAFIDYEEINPEKISSTVPMQRATLVRMDDGRELVVSLRPERFRKWVGAK